ncbi:hypothetical protein HaLaN_27469 [Haematococcus lacustris]|uniref:Uncharacterized protein n=1 Tax=Haematococcus lacustris TaxID=44745 RepID=A0A6A0A8N0_HAELA|nr:hypothetical protein HaLaN_27469 [Haematococcus lacustris]
MDGSSLEQRLAASFGSGPNARAAARQVAVDFSPLRALPSPATALQQQRNAHTGAPSHAPTGQRHPPSPTDGSFAFAVARPPVPEDPLLRTPALPAAQYQPAHAPVPSHMPVSNRLPAKYRTALGVGAHGSSNTSAVPEPMPQGQGSESQNSNLAYYLTSSPPDSPRASPAR